jgi:hypothetical protein
MKWRIIVALGTIVSRVVHYYSVRVSARRYALCMPLPRAVAVFALYIAQDLELFRDSIEVSCHKHFRKFPSNRGLNIIEPVIIYRVTQVVTHRVTVNASFVITWRKIPINAPFEEGCMAGSEPWLIFRGQGSAIV